ncbi:MAG: thiamine pyrophosphate-dependent enzyme [Acidimicrobiales bacterium]
MPGARALLPEGAIVSDEANTSGCSPPATPPVPPPHDWLCLTGGAIGQGLPVALGAAVACPDRKVIALQADGSAMYTMQSWWTMAREDLDVVTIIFNNANYGASARPDGWAPPRAGPRPRRCWTSNLDFVALAAGCGRSHDPSDHLRGCADQLRAALEAAGRGSSSHGPQHHLSPPAQGRAGPPAP